MEVQSAGSGSEDRLQEQRGSEGHAVLALRAGWYAEMIAGLHGRGIEETDYEAWGWGCTKAMTAEREWDSRKGQGRE